MVLEPKGQGFLNTKRPTSRSTYIKSKMTWLETVYPPVSNQEAVWVQDDPAVVDLLRRSDFYMIAGRAEAKFLNLVMDEKAHELRFTYVVGDYFEDSVTVHLPDLPGVANHGQRGYWLEAGEKLIRRWNGPSGEIGSSVLEWFTTEKLIWDRSRERPGILGFDHYRNAAAYNLLYVGIAKVGDTFERLIRRGHKARMEILANEPQRFPGARVADEIYLFMFRVQPTEITSYEPDHVFSSHDFFPVIDQKRIVADAEKAFVSLLQPSYNVVKFGNYPKGADGLHQSEYARYSYSLNEDISFETAHGRIRGRRRSNNPAAFNEADFISIDGDTVKLYISGVDFPADYHV